MRGEMNWGGIVRARAAVVVLVALSALAPGPAAAADASASQGSTEPASQGGADGVVGETPPSPVLQQEAAPLPVPEVVNALPADAAPPSALPALTPAAPAPENALAVVPSTDTGGLKRVVYCNSCQRIWLYNSTGEQVRTYLVSGRRGVPRPGTYHVYSRSPVSYSTKGARLVHMVRFARGRTLGIGFHAIPVGRRGPIQSIGELGHFRSLGCVRQAPADAAFLWDFAPLGTKVIVTA